MRKAGRRSKDATIPCSAPREKEDDVGQRPNKIDTNNERVMSEMEVNDSCFSPEVANQISQSKNDESVDFHALHEQVTDLKNKVDRQYKFSIQKAKNSESVGRFEDQMHLLKTQKVQLLCKMKLESVQFRLSKAALEKEVLQLKKEQRRDKFELRKLLALNQRQKLVLQRKTEEASASAKRLNEFLESRKNITPKGKSAKSENGSGTQGIEFELKLSSRVEEIRSEYERQMEEMQEELRKYEEEAELLREENFRYMLQEKQLECLARDLELKDLKDQILQLSNMVGTITLQKPVQSKQQMEAITSSRHEETDAETSAGKSSSEACCSCSKKSLCKTLKCECRVGRGACGTRCGCSTLKCTNRSPQDGRMDLPAQDMSSAPRKPLLEVGNTPAKVKATAKKVARKTRK